MKSSRANYKWPKIFVPISILQLTNAIKAVKKPTLTDVFTHVFIITWVIVNTDSVAIFLIHSRDKLTSHNRQNKHAKNFITKTIAQAETNANIPTI